MIQPEMHLHCVPTSPVMSKHCFILLLLHLAVTQSQQCFYTAVSSALLTSSKSQLKKNTHTKKKPTRWLTLDHEEHSHCGKEIIPTTWTTLRPEQLWALLIQHNSNAFKVFVLFFFFTMFGVKYFDIITFSIIPAPVGAEPRPGKRNWDRKNKERAGSKKNTQRSCFESPNRLLPSIFSGWNFSLAVRRNSNWWSSCPQPARVKKTSTAHALANPLPHFSPPLTSLSQPGNQWAMHTQTQHGTRRDRGRLLWHVGHTNKSVTRLGDHVPGCMF